MADSTPEALSVQETYTLEELSKAIEDFNNGDFENSYKATETAFNSLSADFAAEDRDWTALGHSGGMYDYERTHAVSLARRYARHDGNCRQIIRLWTQFAIGKGFTWRTEEENVQALVTRYWESPANRNILSAQGQEQSARRLIIDGEVFFAHFPAPRGEMRTRRMDPQEITDFIVDPNDKTSVVGYKREFVPADASSVEKKFYLNWLYRDEPIPKGLVEKTTGKPPKDGLNWEKGVVLQHIPFEEDEWGRGTPLLLSAVVYSKAYRHFIRARAAIQQAVAMFARKIKAKGGLETLNRLLNGNAVGTTASEEVHSQFQPPGSTWAENEGVDMQPLKMDTGASDAQTDAALYLQNIGVGSGIFPHYLGSGDSFRLATAEAMEAPMQKAFESFQQLWIDEYRYIFEFIVKLSDKRRKSLKRLNLDVEAPLILTVDVPRVIHALNETMNVEPAYKELPDLHKMLWTHLGAKDTDEIWHRLNPLIDKRIKKEDKQAEDECQDKKDAAEAKSKALNGDGGQVGSPAPTAGQIQNLPPADKP